jgi:hypothetical protein
MKRLLVAVAVLVAASALTVNAAASPIPGGGTHLTGTWGPPSYLFFVTPGGDLSGGLTAAGCPFVPQTAPQEAATSALSFSFEGWNGPVQDADFNPNWQVLLRTSVAGTVQDQSGNTYRLAGVFLDTSIHYLFFNDLLFDGVGHVTLSGPAGTVTGEAELRVVNGPLEYAFVFTSIQRCDIRQAG